MTDKPITNAELSKQLTEISEDIAYIRKLPMRLVRWLGGLIVASAIGVSVQNFMQHSTLAAAVQQVATAQTKEATAQTQETTTVAKVAKVLDSQ